MRPYVCADTDLMNPVSESIGPKLNEQGNFVPNFDAKIEEARKPRTIDLVGTFR